MECISMSKVYIARRDQRKKKSLEIFDLASKYKIPIFITEPKNEKGVQIADFVSWAIFRKIEFGDDLYFSKLRNVEFLAKIKP
jgi:hypothetical protein